MVYCLRASACESPSQNLYAAVVILQFTKPSWAGPSPPHVFLRTFSKAWTPYPSPKLVLTVTSTLDLVVRRTFAVSAVSGCLFRSVPEVPSTALQLPCAAARESRLRQWVPVQPPHFTSESGVQRASRLMRLHLNHNDNRSHVPVHIPCV